MLGGRGIRHFYYLWLTSSISPPAPVVMVLSIQPFGATSFARARLKITHDKLFISDNNNYNKVTIKTTTKIIRIIIINKGYSKLLCCYAIAYRCF